MINIKHIIKRQFTLTNDVVFIEDIDRKVATLYNLKTGLRSELNEDHLTILKEIMNGLSLKEITKKLVNTGGNKNTGENAVKVIKKAIKQGFIKYGDPLLYPYSLKKIKTHPPLQYIFWEITRRCNLKCKYCYASSIPEAKLKAELTTEECKAIIDEANALGIWRIAITGGEPFLRKDIFDLLHYMSDKGMFISIFSNGTLLSREYIDELSKLHLRSVYLNIDGRNPSTHDSIRGVKGAFRKTWRAAKRLKSLGIPLTINIAACLQNKEELLKLFDLIKGDLKTNFRCSHIAPLGRGENAQNIPLKELVNIFCDYAIHNFDKNSVFKKLAEGLPGMIEENIKLNDRHPNCGVGYDLFFISPNGKVGLCPLLNYHTNKIFLAGNLREKSIKEIWENSPVFQRFRNIQCQKINSCKFRFCRGGCRGQSYLASGEINSPDIVACRMFKELEKRIIALYA